MSEAPHASRNLAPIIGLARSKQRWHRHPMTPSAEPSIADPPSWYAARAASGRRHPKLRGRLRVDVAIVGGGFTGVSAALHLAERGYAVALLEAQRIGYGASGRNGGQVSSGQRRPVEELEAAHGAVTASTLWDLAEEAKALVEERVARHAIACDLKPGVIEAAHKRRHLPSMRRHVEFMAERYGYARLSFLEGEAFRERVASPDYHGGIVDEGAFHLDPLACLRGLADAACAAGARLFEGSRVVRVERGATLRLKLEGAEVEASSALIACNGYLGDLEPALAARILPLNNFVVATEPLGEARARALIRDDMAVCDTRHVIDYFRLTADRRLLFGGGETYGFDFPDDIAAFVRPYVLRTFPQLADVRIDHAWGGTLGITTSRLPCFTRLAPEVLAVGGFSGHGISIGTLAGRLVAEATAGQAERFDLMAKLAPAPFPGGTRLRRPLLVLGMLWYKLRDLV
ncbi:MAG: FAD-binding oxidoreductase [Geminicoccaceae bacterium]|nr:FAD-binding oxidoreductase [Geminicoccaceae bacterium]